MKNNFCLIGVCVMMSTSIYSQTKTFTDEQLFKNRVSNVVLGTPVVRWVDDDHISIARRTATDTTLRTFRYDVATGMETETVVRRTLSEAGMRRLGAGGKRIVTERNDLYLSEGGDLTRLTTSAEEEKNPTFSPDSNYIAYTRSNNLFTYHFGTKKETQLTSDGTATTLNGYASWVYYEEIFGRPTRYRAFWWNPNSKQLCYMHFDESMVPIFPIYNSEGQHGFVEQTRYPKAGDKNPDVKVGFVSADGGATTWADFNERDDQYFGWPIWRPDGSSILVQWINRGQDDLKIYDVNPGTGSKKLFYEEQQKTWVDLEGGRIEFFNDGKNLLLKSDKTGWNHLYLYTSDGKLQNAVTSGNYSVKEILRSDFKNGIIYFTARKEASTCIDFYSVRLNGKDLKRLTTGNYNYSAIQLSPSGKNFLATYSNATTPPAIALYDNTGKFIKQVADTKGPEFSSYALAKTELLKIKSEDGKFDLPALVTWPANMQSGKRYPVLVSIYGGPDAGTVMDSWVWTATRQWMAQEGLIQIALDHRASGHFGKEGVNYMYRNLGNWELKDYSTMVKYLIDKGYADPTKICITGFSYGGYMTCLALTQGSDIFTHGMAGGSVTDWSLYDSHYTEKFMDTPTENPDGYKNGSPLTYIDKYRGMLQIVHGTMDDNVHMQNSIQIISALQEKKKNFEFMLYPGGRHGWPNLPAKNDHFTNLKTAFIYRYLLEKPMPQGLLK
jgi:dipeptidyl-peptidase 4